MLAALVLSGCPSVRPVIGSVSLTIKSGSGAKTVLPVVSVSSYRISFSGPVAMSDVDTTQSTSTIELDVGTWTINVAGSDGGKNVVAAGSATGVVVTTGVTTSVSIVLSALSSGTGAIDVTVTWPTLTPAVDTCVVTLDGSVVSAGAVTFTAGGTSVRYTEGKAAGNHQLIIDLYSGSVLRASVSEAVQVYGNLTSSATIALTAADFTLPPAAPSGLVAVEGLGGVDLSWTNNSHVANGCEVDRSSDNVSFTVLAGTLGPTATSYHDGSAATGQTYWYKVAAKNNLGSSYSNEASGAWQAPIPGGSGALTFGSATSSSVPVSWQMATDNVTAANALAYKVVQSQSDNVQTATDAQNNGTVVQDWTPNIGAVNATGLSAGTLYYFNLLVKDGAGNISAYFSGSAMTSPATGFISLTVTVTSPQDALITFSQPDAIVVAPDTTMTITVAQGFDSYAWLLDGVALAMQTSATVTIDCTTLELGPHHLTAFVMLQGNLFSKSLQFSVQD